MHIRIWLSFIAGFPFFNFVESVNSHPIIWVIIVFAILTIVMTVVPPKDVKDNGAQAILENGVLSDDQRDRITAGLGNDTALLCTWYGQLRTNYYQFLGEVYGNEIKSGMSIQIPGGDRYEISEIYSNDNISDNQDLVLSTGQKGVSVMTKNISRSDRKKLDKILYSDDVVILKVLSR